MITGTISKPIAAWPAVDLADGRLARFPAEWRQDSALLAAIEAGRSVPWIYWPASDCWALVVGLDVLCSEPGATAPAPGRRLRAL